MTTGNFARVDLNVAFRVTAEQQDGLIQQNARTIGQGDKLRRHETTHLNAATAGGETCRV
jgi:hypothetical protein